MMRIIHQLAWPLELRPGDERYVDRAICLTTERHRIKIEFLFGEDVRVVGAYTAGINSFVFPRKMTKRCFGMKYIAMGQTATPVTKDVSVIVYRQKVAFLRAIVVGSLVAIALVPLILQYMQPGALAVRLEVAGFLLAVFPISAVFGMVLFWRQIYPLIVEFVHKDVFAYEVIGEHGTAVGAIGIVDKAPSTNVRTWHPHEGYDQPQ